jgi:RNA polymerase sigma-70 factor (ECF subfamily)
VVCVDDFDTTFRAHYPRLVRSLTVVSGSAEAASDAVQEAFVKAHLRWHTVSRYDDPVGWIRRVAINKLRDEYRRSTRKRSAVERLAAQPTAGVAEPSVDELTPLLAGLPRQQRLALALYYVEGLSLRQTAEAIGVSEGAVKFHLHSGRERLRGILVKNQLSDDY